MFDGTKNLCNIWRETDLCFEKWHEEFSKWDFDGILLSKVENVWA